MTQIFTIGYGNRTIENFINLLLEYRITTLIDVRSKPHSRFTPVYNKSILQTLLQNAGIDYLYFGSELGGKPKDNTLYTNGRLNYDAVNALPHYQAAVSKLIHLSETNSVCIMCCELNPDNCHRKNLIGATLISQNIEVKHINERGLLTETSFLNQLGLF